MTFNLHNYYTRSTLASDPLSLSPTSSEGSYTQLWGRSVDTRSKTRRRGELQRQDGGVGGSRLESENLVEGDL